MGLKLWMSGRSPRQWKMRCGCMPRNVCVVIGPFMGCMTRGRGVESWMELFLPLTVTMTPFGSPRSQARPSRSVSRWQLAQLAVPLPESLASKRYPRPCLTSGGIGSWLATAVSASRGAVAAAAVSITEMVSDNLFITYSRSRVGCKTKPRGPRICRLSAIDGRTSMRRTIDPSAPESSATRSLPKAATHSRAPSWEKTIDVG